MPKQDALIVSAPLVPPAATEKHIFFNLLNGRSVSETVKHNCYSSGCKGSSTSLYKVGHNWMHLFCPVDMDPVLNYCKKMAVFNNSGRFI